jgi:hypothetical protein
MTATEHLPLSGRRDPAANPPAPTYPRRPTDSELLLSIRNLLRIVVAIWVTLILVGGLGGYAMWQDSRCEESSYSSSC